MTAPIAARLPDGRLHLQAGPIDLVIGATGDALSVRRAELRAATLFPAILPELVAELPALRRPAHLPATPDLRGAVARRMLTACRPHLPCWVTPMAAVAGAVADHLLAAMRDVTPDIETIHVNNGGDVAIHVAGERCLTVGLVSDLAGAGLDGRLRLTASDGVGGVATSGRGGRSLSLGIADSVTVLAASAAAADVAATLIANAVDLPGHPAIRRGPARLQDPDSDLGDRLVTLGVGPLAADAVARALDAGAALAETMVANRLAIAAILRLRGAWRVVGKPGARSSREHRWNIDDGAFPSRRRTVARVSFAKRLISR